MEKIAVVLPGAEYSAEMPVLASVKELARNYGYRLVEIVYGPGVVTGAEAPKQEKFYVRMLKNDVIERVEPVFSELNLETTQLLFIAKGIGCAFATAIMECYGCHSNILFFSPIESALSGGSPGEGPIFYGMKDRRIPKRILRKYCQEYQLPLFLLKEADHNLEVEGEEEGQTLDYIKKICSYALENKKDPMWELCDNIPPDNPGQVIEDELIQGFWEEAMVIVDRLSHHRCEDEGKQLAELGHICDEMGKIVKVGSISDGYRERLMWNLEREDFYNKYGCAPSMEAFYAVLKDEE